MKRIVVGLICGVVCAHAIEYSTRIQALGTDFAYLIPDYETDLYRDMDQFGNKMVGISYDREASFSTKPAKGILLTSRFGWYGRYWGECGRARTGGEDYWSTSRHHLLHFEDVWMVDMRGHIWKFMEGVWHLYNDGYYTDYELTNSSGNQERNTELAYFFKGQGTHKFSDVLKISSFVGAAFYWQRLQEGNVDHINELLYIPSGRVGLFYRNTTAANKFTSWYIDIGGPISTAEIDALPYSLSSDEYWWFVSGTDLRIVWFANAITNKIAWVKGIPIHNDGFVAIGAVNDFRYQRTIDPDTNLTQLGIDNTLTVPLAVEYTANRVAVRFGTKCYYHYSRRRINDSAVLYSQNSSHTLEYTYSFGFGWKPTDELSVDVLYARVYDFDLHDWSVYAKYAW